MSAPPAVFWRQDPAQNLLRPDRWHQFWPEGHMTLEERHHAILRFTLYLSLILCWYYASLMPLLLVSIALVLSAYMYDYEQRRNRSLLSSASETDALGDLMDDAGQLPPHRHVRGSGGVDCTRPTINNPYMNVTMADRMDGIPRDPACTHPQIQQEIQRIEQEEIGYHDTTDLYDRSSSQRQFYTMPDTGHPSSRDDFLNYLYPLKPTCKERPDQCNYFELLQAKRQF